ncbi:hypothetical protein ACHAWC_008238 [Mediolabrus comicus]
MAENTQFVSGFFKGLADRDPYRSLITSLYFVYEAMEEAMDKSPEDAMVLGHWIILPCVDWTR